MVIANDEAPSNLVPALAFWHPPHDGIAEMFDIMDVDVSGSFPSSFTLDVFEPPTEGAFIAFEPPVLPSEPRIALGYVTAVPPDHAAVYRLPRHDSSMSCFNVCYENPACAPDEVRSDCISLVAGWMF